MLAVMEELGHNKEEWIQRKKEEKKMILNGDYKDKDEDEELLTVKNCFKSFFDSKWQGSMILE
jgi:hypothetical protein